MFFTLALTDSYSVFTIRYQTSQTWTGGGHTVSGDYSGTSAAFDHGGEWKNQIINCPASDKTCYTITNGIGWIEFTFYGLSSLPPLDSTALNCYKDYVNSNDSLVNVYIGPYVP